MVRLVRRTPGEQAQPQAELIVVRDEPVSLGDACILLVTENQSYTETLIKCVFVAL